MARRPERARAGCGISRRFSRHPELRGSVDGFVKLDDEPRRWFPCPLLRGEVELTSERERHIQDRHPELRVILGQRIRETLQAPDAVRPSTRRPQALEFMRWYPVFPHRKWVIVVVISDRQSNEARHWVVTSYVTSKDRTGGPA